MATKSLTVEHATAAKWWADQLVASKGPLADQVGAEDDSPMRDPFGAGLFDLLAAKESQGITREVVEQFRAALESALNDPATDGYERRVLGVDYHPDRILGNALDVAGLNAGSMSLLPLKTVMWIEPGSVRVSKGYGAPIADVPPIAPEDIAA